MKKKRILWADDEIDILRPHILFLEEKGYEVIPVNSGQDALESFRSEALDIVFLDENMPGLTGIETLARMKEMDSSVPIVMITKSEDESVMTYAIGKKIADYLIKPVNPNQILLSLKKNLHEEDIRSEVTLEGYREEFTSISQQIASVASYHDWVEIYKKLIYWESELINSQSLLIELLRSQKHEANAAFTKYIKENYESWIKDKEMRPLMSHDVFHKKVFPQIDEGEHLFFVLIDNFRLDQWNEVRDLLSGSFTFVEDTFCSILPTATQYARNAIFAGMMPADISKTYPQLWVDEADEGSKNVHEEELMQSQIDRFRKKYTVSYNKIMTSVAGEKLIQNIHSLQSKQLNVVVVNFVDMMSHARTDSKMMRELAADEAAYRSLTRSWFKHSSTLDMFKRMAELKCKVILTTDHGTIRVKTPLKILSDKIINANVRYKAARSVEYDRKKVYDVLDPQQIGLPSPNINTKYIFATGDDFFVYSNNFNQYASYYTDTFQHGGISLEEMIVPYITLIPK